MTSDEYKEEHLCDLLPLYYKRIFPHQQFYRWLSYGIVFEYLISFYYKFRYRRRKLYGLSRIIVYIAG